jgi:hypothetical protein
MNAEAAVRAGYGLGADLTDVATALLHHHLSDPGLRPAADKIRARPRRSSSGSSGSPITAGRRQSKPRDRAVGIGKVRL